MIVSIPNQSEILHTRPNQSSPLVVSAVHPYP